MHQKRSIDRGTEVTEGSGPGESIQVGSRVPPPPEKLQRTSSTIVLPEILGIWFGVFQMVLPVCLFNCSQPSRLRTVGIASVGTESVGIAWCTPL